MVWTMETSCGFESDKIAAFVVPYLQGKVLDIGCGQRTVWPTAIGIDNGHHFGSNSVGVRGDGTDLSMFADESMDGVFSSHTLEHIPRDKVPGVLREWARVLKVGGHLCLYIPSGNLYPRIGEPGGNKDHKWDPMPGDVEAMLWGITHAGSKASRVGWTLLESEERSGTNEYSLFIVVRKEKSGHGWSKRVWQRNPDGKKRALICRFGAIGDQIVASSILPGLKAQGYHITYMTTPQSQKVLLHDPNIDEWWIQETDYVPNQQLGPYWESIATRYDKFINLSESIEGSLLAIPHRLNHGYSDGSRRQIMGTVNYYERTHDIADVPHLFAPKFFPLKAEEAVAEQYVRSLSGGPIIMWCIHGSSFHKVYPWTHIAAKWLVERAGAHVVLSGDAKEGKQLQDGLLEVLERDGCDMTHIHPMAGEKGIRDILTLAQKVDCVVGPETGVLNSVAVTEQRKVVYLSHSSHQNLTKYWTNTTVVTPDADRCPCYPCHRLHYGPEHCVTNLETNAAQCASSIAPEVLFDAIMTRLGFIKKEHEDGLALSDGYEKFLRKHSAVG